MSIGYYERTGDFHTYPEAPHSPETIRFLRTLGHDTKPIFLSEYGIGSLMNVIRESRNYEQAGAYPGLEDMALMRSMLDKFVADWNRFEMNDVYPFPEDMLRDSQRLHSRQRLLGFDLIRSNPKINGYSLSGMLDGEMTGGGLWTFWRELKPGVIDALADGWASLRWCLFVEPLHGYANRKFKFEAVLANEDVLKPDEYPVCFRVFGPDGVIWEKRVNAIVPEPADGEDGPFAVSVICEEVRLPRPAFGRCPAGIYEFAANMESGGAPAGGRLKFYVSDNADFPKLKTTVTLWGIEKRIEDWLKLRGISCNQFKNSSSVTREVILVGDLSGTPEDLAGWRELASRMARGSMVIFLSSNTFRSSPKVSAGRLERKGNIKHSVRDNFEVKNMPEDEKKYFTKEFWGEVHYLMSGIPDGEYVIELGMCEGFYTEQGKRIFDVLINGSVVLEKFDIVKEAGGDHLAVIKKFKVKPENGKIEIKFIPRKDNPSLSILRIYNMKEELIAEDSASEYLNNPLAWLPLENKGRCYEFNDNL